MPDFYRGMEIVMYAVLNFLPYLILALYPFRDSLRCLKGRILLLSVLVLLIADSSRKQMLIICYLENVDSIVRQLSKTGNHMALKSVLNNLKMYYNEFENMEDYYKCVWIGISVLSQLIEILCSYDCHEEALFITSLFWETVAKYNIYKDNDWALNQHKESSINRILTSVFIDDDIKQMFLLG